MKRSHGYLSKHSRKLGSGRKTIPQLLRVFDVGANVRIKVDGASAKVPMRFNGRIVKITARQGKGYVVEFKDLNKTKKLTLMPMHLATV
ncbi:MAG: hypothetical protein V1722_02655 [Candidatus Micrarchaeota archaeon]